MIITISTYTGFHWFCEDWRKMNIAFEIYLPLFGAAVSHFSYFLITSSLIYLNLLSKSVGNCQNNLQIMENYDFVDTDYLLP